MSQLGQLLTPPFPWQHTQWNSLWLAQAQNRLSHALIFSGEPGIGKALFAQVVAQALFCQQRSLENQACGKCRPCRLMQAQAYPDFFCLEPEKGTRTIKMEAVCDLIEKIQQTPQQGHCKVILISPAECLGKSGSNALLKTLEEPPPQTYFFLVTQAFAFLPATVRSRCQQIRCSLSHQDVQKTWLMQQLPALAESKIDQLLTLAHGAPITAFSMATDDEQITFIRLIGESFLKIAEGKEEPLQLAEKLVKLSLTQVLIHIIHLITLIIYFKFTRVTTELDQWLKGHSLAYINDKIPLVNLYHYLDKLYTVKRDSQYVSLNTQLMLEELFFYWKDLSLNLC